jgi:hypothetical protein
MYRSALAVLAWLMSSLITAAAERELRVTAPENLFPALKVVVVVKAGAPGPGVPKHEAVAAMAKYGDSIKLKSEGPFDLWWQPKEGLAVKAVDGLKIAEGVKEIKLDEYLGVVRFRGDDQPRARLVTLTPQDDPGPEEKGHVAAQTASDYRVDMVVPAGFYALWVTPDNGARARKVNDRLRVLPGKVTQLD